MLERHELDAFLTLARELHFGRTAERLRVSTARVSQTIQRLERRIGVPLFNRTSRRVELTAIGQRLRDEIQPAWTRIGSAVEAAIEAGKGLTGTLRVAFVSAAAGQFLFRATDRFRNRHPECQVEIREATSARFLPWLRDGEVDMGLGTLPMGDTDISSGPVLYTDPRMLAVPSTHPFARRESVSLEDLAHISLLRMADTVDERIRADRSPTDTPGGRPIETGPTAASLTEILAFVGAGRGAFTVGSQIQRYYARPDVAYVPFSDAPPLKWGLLWRTDNATARVLAFNQTAQDVTPPGP